MSENKKATNDKLSPGFKFFYATSCNGASALITGVAATYFAAFMTDTMLLPATACSVIMFIATLWDAVNDPMMGVLADRTNTKWGRYRPYLLFTPVLMLIFSTLLWLNPNLGTSGKIIYILVVYICYGMTITLYTMPFKSLLPACTMDDGERNSAIWLSTIAGVVAFSIASSFTTNITGFFENTLGFSNGYVPMMFVFGLLCIVTFWGLFANSKEKYVVQREPAPPLKAILDVMKLKGIYPLMIIWLVFWLGYGLSFSAAVYYLTYYMGNPALISPYFLMNSVTGLVAITVVFPMLLKIAKTTTNAFMFTLAGSTVICAILFLFGSKSVPLLFVGSTICNMFTTMQLGLVNALVNDAIDYVQWKNGVASNGVVSSVQGFAQKCGNTLSSSGFLMVLGLAGYVANAEQTPSALFAINFMRYGFPVVQGIICIICLRFNPARIHAKEISEMKARIAASVGDNE